MGYAIHLRNRIAACIMLAALGCARAPVVEFNQLADVTELPDRHQQNIAQGLVRFFGTPNAPRQREIDPAAMGAGIDVEEGREPQVTEENPILTTPLVDVVTPSHLKDGANVFNARCAGCHGITGDGAGPAGEFLRPRPRDYRQGVFKFTSTPYGAKPARHDLVRVIRRGAKGTSMPSFPWMSNSDLDAVVDYVLFLSKRGELERNLAMMAPEYLEDEDIDFVEFTGGMSSINASWQRAESQVVLPASAEPEYGETSVAEGRKLFLSQGCASCHGQDGKGQVEWLNPEFLAEQESLPESQRVKINFDAWGEPAPAADLTARMLHGGRRPIDIYRRIATGINGTPMPAFGGLFAENPEGIWHLVHYVRHVIDGGDPTAGVPSTPAGGVGGSEGQGDPASGGADDEVPPDGEADGQAVESVEPPVVEATNQ